MLWIIPEVYIQVAKLCFHGAAAFALNKPTDIKRQKSMQRFSLEPCKHRSSFSNQFPLLFKPLLALLYLQV